MAAGSRTIGGTLRYDTILKLASGGMASVYVGTVRGALGFRQLVAIKKPHSHLMENADFRRELLAEAQLASMIHHANVVDVRDVELDRDSISLVMDYIEGASLGELLVAASKGIAKMPAAVAVRIVLDACAGLHAAHELTDDKGRFVGLVHRDISPQNILVGVDGVARVTDFGIAKFARKQSATQEGNLRGKLAYMAPEYVRGEAIDRRFDVFGMGVVLWEALTGQRLFRGDHEAETLQRLLHQEAPKVSTIAPGVGASLDAVVHTAVEKSRDDRFQSIAAMASALETAARNACLVASSSDVAAVVRAAVGPDLEERRTLIRARLAQEPSIASVGPQTPGVTPDAAPPTIATGAPIGSATLPAVSGVPSTMPMQPSSLATAGAPSTEPMANAAPARTLLSAGAAPQPLPPAMATLKSAPQASTLPSGSPALGTTSPMGGVAAVTVPFGATVPMQASTVTPPHVSFANDDPQSELTAIPKKSNTVIIVATLLGLAMMGAAGAIAYSRMHAVRPIDASGHGDELPNANLHTSPRGSAGAADDAPSAASATGDAPPLTSATPLATTQATTTAPHATGKRPLHSTPTATLTVTPPKATVAPPPLPPPGSPPPNPYER